MNTRGCTEYQQDMAALYEGALGQAAEAALLRHVESCPLCRAEYGWFRTLRSDFEAIGDAEVAGVPAIDVADSVMDAVRSGAVSSRMEAASAPIPFEPRRDALRPGRFWAAGWMGLVAAAAAVFVLWFSGFRVTREPASIPPQTQVATVRDSSAQPDAPGRSSTPASATRSTDFDDIRHLLNHSRRAQPSETPKGEPEMKKVEDLTPSDVLVLRREAITDPDARAQLAEWASLTEEKARAVANAADASLDAKIGASQALPAAEAERILVAAVKAKPDDPYLRSELAKAYSANPETAAEATSQLSELARLDPNNAFAQYKLASNLFSRGEFDAAAAALDRARTLEETNTYAQEADKYRQQALVAAGTESETARLLTALTAGANQYAEIILMAQQLLEYGHQSEQQGDINDARHTYEGVQQMGEQIAATAPTSSEHLAGLDTQSNALDSLAALFTVQGWTQEMQAIETQLQGLRDAYDAVAQFFQELDAFFSGEITDNLLTLIADFISQNGDINLVEHFSNTATTPAP